MSIRPISFVALALAMGACSVEDATPSSSIRTVQQRSGGFIDREENLVNVPSQLSAGVAQLSDAVSFISKVGDGVSGTIKVLQFLGFLPSDVDQLRPLFDDIKQTVTALGVTLSKEMAAADRDLRITHMRTNLNVVSHDILKSGGGSIDDSVLNQEEIAELGDAMLDSQNAAQNGGAPSAFTRVFSEHPTDGTWKQLVSNRPGCTMGVGDCTFDVVPQGDVFDWRLGMTEFIGLIASRLTVIGATEPDFKTTGLRNDELRQYRDRLLELYQQMMGGIQCGSHRGPVLDVVCADVYSGLAESTQVDEPTCNSATSPVCQARIDVEKARLKRKVMAKLPLFQMRTTIDGLSVLIDPDSNIEGFHRIRLHTSGSPQCLGQTWVGQWADNPDDPSNPILLDDLWTTHVVSCSIDWNQEFTYDRESKHILNGWGFCLAPSQFEVGPNIEVRRCNGDPGERWSYDPTTGVLQNGNHSVLAGPPAPFLSDAARSEDLGSSTLQSWQPYAIESASRSLLWHNRGTGELGTWFIDTSGNVTGGTSLSRTCADSDGCANRRVAATLDLNRDGNVDVLWHDTSTGAVTVWLLDEHGTVIGDRTLSWGCGSDCVAASWSIIAALDVNHDEQPDLLWQNFDSGEISAWLLDKRGNVIGTQSLSSTCDPGCSRVSSAVAAFDVDSDGNTDLLWHDVEHGDLTAWLLNQGQVTGLKSLSVLCGAGDGCSQAYRVIGAADFNGDGTKDVLWYDEQSGYVTNWLLDGNGTYIGQQWISWTCDTPSGCAASWKPVGLINVH